MATVDELDDESRMTFLVGRVARESAGLEYATGALLAAVINKPPAGLVLSFGQSFFTTADMLLALVNDPNAHNLDQPEFNDRIRAAVTESKSLMGERNLVVHGMMPMLGGPGFALLTKRFDRRVQRQFTHNEASDLADRLATAAATTREINNKMVMG